MSNAASSFWFNETTSSLPISPSNVLVVPNPPSAFVLVQIYVSLFSSRRRSSWERENLRDQQLVSNYSEYANLWANPSPLNSYYFVLTIINLTVFEIRTPVSIGFKLQISRNNIKDITSIFTLLFFK